MQPRQTYPPLAGVAFASAQADAPRGRRWPGVDAARPSQRSRILALTIFFTCATLLSFAQKATFLYLQGDKKTPFYVKLDGQMQPRYGKNYCIIPELTTGVANIEVLFQQNAFPAQKFAIKIPDGGERGFLIVEKSGAISLYDLEQEFYLPAGNKADEDHLPQRQPVVATTTPSISTPASPKPIASAPQKTPRERTARESRPPRTRQTVVHERTGTPTTNQAIPSANSSEPRFIPNLSLDTAGARTSGNTAFTTGCGEPMDVQSFAALYRKALDIGEQDDRLVFLNKQTDGCFSPTQLRLLARVLDRDAARFTFLKKIQLRITVAARFAELEDLLASEAYRARFRELLAQ